MEADDVALFLLIERLLERDPKETVSEWTGLGQEGERPQALRECLKSPDSVIFHRLCFPFQLPNSWANPGPRTVSLDLPGLFKHPLIILGAFSKVVQPTKEMKGNS
jgi:hypothetical protein